MKLSINIKGLPVYARIILALLPAAILSGLVIFFLILPKHKEIKEMDAKISKQENEIARDQAKADKLQELTVENERLRNRLEALKQQLPEEKEVSTLLKQVSDLCLQSGMKIALWKPEQKKTHSSGIVYEIPVRVELGGSYHSLGYFFSSLTRLERIVNISNIKMSDPKPDRDIALGKIAFTATTFSVVPEDEIKDASKDQTKGKQAGR
jgi:type IV pilus assembly protein PilO